MEFNFEEKLFKKVSPIFLREFKEFQEAHHFRCLEFRDINGNITLKELEIK